MFIQEFKGLCFIGDSMRVKLPRRNLILDPRAHVCRFDCHYHDDGVTVTLTRLNDVVVVADYYEEGGRFSLRVFDPSTDPIPDFDSKTYLYLGLDGERAPADTIVGIVDPSVKTIKTEAFSYCVWMERCILHDQVEIIEACAFENCISLSALFLPSSLKDIQTGAFCDSSNIRILPLPLNIELQQCGYMIIANCNTFFRVTQIQEYEWGNSDQVNRAIIDFHNTLPPLHKACLNINVSAQSIRECIITHGADVAYNDDYDGMTPMHILALNPHASVGCIQACFAANMSAVFVRYSGGFDEQHDILGDKTPLDCLMEYDVESHTSVVASLCVHRRNAMMGGG